jgi:uncharacterized protein YbjQ (UPF0145 family)
MEALVPLGLTAALLLLGFVAGSLVERRHLADLVARETRLRSMPVTNFETLPAEWTVVDSGLVVGSCVVSVDYFKRFVAGLRALFGGRIRSYEPLLDRGRREALARMLEAARARGYDAVVNVRLETSRTANDAGVQQSPVAGVEMVASGTGLRRAAP